MASNATKQLRPFPFHPLAAYSSSYSLALHVSRPESLSLSAPRPTLEHKSVRHGHTWVDENKHTDLFSKCSIFQRKTHKTDLLFKPRSFWATPRGHTRLAREQLCARQGTKDGRNTRVEVLHKACLSSTWNCAIPDHSENHPNLQFGAISSPKYA